MHFQQLMTTHWMYLSSLDGILRYIVEVLIVVIGCICGHWMASWGLVLGDVVELYCNICGLWFWLVLGFHKLVVINMWMMMNMWLVVVIYCEKMGSVSYIYVMVDIYIYICIYMKCLCRWNAKNKKKIKFLPLCRGQWPRPSAKKGPLPRAQAIALGKDFFGKKSWQFLCRGPGSRPSAKG